MPHTILYKCRLCWISSFFVMVVVVCYCLFLFCCCCFIVVVLLLLFCCCSFVVVLLLLFFCCCCCFAVLLFCFSCCCFFSIPTLVSARWSDHNFFTQLWAHNAAHNSQCRAQFAMPHTIHNAADNCNQCDFASSPADALRTHLKTHSGEKSNKCNQCDFACSDTNSLWRHLKTHNGEKPNKCSQCEFPTSQAGNWGYIWKRTNECNQCDFASSQAGNLRVHLKTHSREKPNIYQSNLPSLPTYLTFLPEKHLF